MRDAEAEATFQAERRKVTGGSDVHHLRYEEPYGCRRELWYDKTGVEPDYPLKHEGVLKRGTVLEPIAADEWLQQYGKDRKLRHVRFRTHPDYPYMGAHVDYEILKDERGPGILSVKVPGERVFREIRREGLPAAYLMQLQWELGITGRTWGAYAIFWADGWQLESFEVARDDALIQGLQVEAHRFWREVENGPAPDRLPVDDRRCMRCPWVKTCQGVELTHLDREDVKKELEADDSLLPILFDWSEQKRRVKDADEVFELIDGRLREELGARGAVKAGDFKVYYRRQLDRVAFDLKEFELKEPEAYLKLFEKYRKTVPGPRPLRVYE
jgi:predicted phage-related endonuclease